MKKIYVLFGLTLALVLLNPRISPAQNAPADAYRVGAESHNLKTRAEQKSLVVDTWTQEGRYALASWLNNDLAGVYALIKQKSGWEIVGGSNWVLLQEELVSYGFPQDIANRLNTAFLKKLE